MTSNLRKYLASHNKVKTDVLYVIETTQVATQLTTALRSKDNVHRIKHKSVFFRNKGTKSDDKIDIFNMQF